MIRLTCVLAVSRAQYSWPAISSLDSPSATRASTSRSRSVSADEGAGRRPAAPGRRRDSAISRRVTPGDSRASPRGDDPDGLQQLRGLGVLDQEPARPGPDGLEHVLVELERGQDDHLDAGQVRSSAAIRRVASSPSTPGIRMSISTTSGALAAGQLHRCCAVDGLTDHLQVAGRARAAPGSRRGPAPGRRPAGPGSRLSGPRRAARSNFPGAGFRLADLPRPPRLRDGQPGRDPESARGPRPRLDDAADGRGPLAHAGQAGPVPVPRSAGSASRAALQGRRRGRRRSPRSAGPRPGRPASPWRSPGRRAGSRWSATPARCGRRPARPPRAAAGAGRSR